MAFWISKVQKSAGDAVYVVRSCVVYSTVARVTATFGDLSNAIECFMTILEGGMTRNEDTIYAFSVWEARPVMKISLHTDRPERERRALLEKCRAEQIGMLTKSPR